MIILHPSALMISRNVCHEITMQYIMFKLFTSEAKQHPGFFLGTQEDLKEIIFCLINFRLYFTTSHFVINLIVRFVATFSLPTDYIHVNKIASDH